MHISNVMYILCKLLYITVFIHLPVHRHSLRACGFGWPFTVELDIHPLRIKLYYPKMKDADLLFTVCITELFLARSILSERQ